jgi:hypothetical protein
MEQNDLVLADDDTSASRIQLSQKWRSIPTAVGNNARGFCNIN